MTATSLSTDQLKLQARARELAAGPVTARAAEVDRSEQYPWDNVGLLKDARLIGNVGFFAFSATIPIIAIVYFTYWTYMKNVEGAASQAEQARRHVEELNLHIAEQERISKALRETEEHFRNAFDLAAIGMALVSPQGAWLRVNRALCDLLDRTEPELLDSNFQDVTHPDDVGNDLAAGERVGRRRILPVVSDQLNADADAPQRRIVERSHERPVVTTRDEHVRGAVIGTRDPRTLEGARDAHQHVAPIFSERAPDEPDARVGSIGEACYWILAQERR